MSALRFLLLPAALLGLAASSFGEGAACCEKPVSRAALLTKGGGAGKPATNAAGAAGATLWKPVSISGGAVLCLLGLALVARRKHAAELR